MPQGTLGSALCGRPLPYARQLLTSPTMSQLSLSRSSSICELARLVLVKAAQQKALWVRTAMGDVPGRLLLVHRLPSLFGFQPQAESGLADPPFIMVRIR